MKTPLEPIDEAGRLDALDRYDVLDTLPEQAFDELTALAALVCETPIALISLVDEHRQWFKSNVGFPLGEASRDVSFCGHALLEPDLLIVPDAARDERFADNPLVTGEMGIRFYAGAPLLTPEGLALGTLCVMDRVPRELTGAQQQALRVLSRQVMSELDLRLYARALAGRERLLNGIFDSEPECVKLLGPDGSLRMMNRAGLRMIEADSFEQVAGRCLYPLLVPEYRVRFEALTARVFRGESGILAFQMVGMKGTPRWLETNATPLRDEHGIVTALLGITRDITEQRRSEQALASSREALHAIIQSVDGIVWEADAATFQFTFVSPAAERLLDYPVEQWLREPDFWRDHLHPDDRDWAMEFCLKAVGEMRNHQFEYRMLAADGRTVWLRDIASVIVENGRPTILRGLMVDITDQKRTEDALRAGEERYRSTLDSILEGCQLIGFDWRYLYLNDAAARHNRRPNSELLGRTMMESWPGIEATGVFAMLRRCLMERIALNDEVEFVFPDGGKGWFDIRSQPVPDGIFVLSIDISERKQAELRIQYLNRVYAVLSDINETILREKDPQAMLAIACRVAVEKGEFRMAWIGLVDAATGRLHINAHAGADASTLGILERLIETDPPGGCSFTGQALQTGQHGICNDVARDPAAVAWRGAALEREYQAMAAFPLKAGDRVIGTFNLYAAEMNFFDGDEVRLLDALAMDISFALEIHQRERERQRADEQRHVAEERFRELAENIQEVFWMTDPVRSEVFYVSPAYETIWGRTCASLYESPRTWLDAVHPEDRDRVARSSIANLGQRETTAVYRITRPDGSVRWIRDRAFPVRNAAGDVLRILGTAEDITAQRHLEDQYRQSQKMEAIGQLAGGVAHDFNNILAAMMLQAEMASLQDDLSADTRGFLQEIKATAERGADLTRQLLTFSRRQVMQQRTLDLNEVVTSLTTMLQRILGADVRLQLNLHSRPLFTRADAGMLDQVLMNLVVNARDAMPGGGRLVIETGERKILDEEAQSLPNVMPGRHVSFRITDTGSGIPPEALPHVFEPFFTTKEPGKGTGLGLATVFGIVKQHGGSLQVVSEVGRGTTFEILLPTAEGPDLAAAQDAAKPQSRGGTETILVVEDEPAVRRLSRSLLERYGYTVLEATHGVDALRIWEQHAGPIHLLLTDMVMPEGIDGRALATRLLEQDPQLKVVFTSGYSADIAGRELKLKPGQGFIQKPTAPQEFLGTVRRCLDS